MAELFPEDPKLENFSSRFSAGDGFGLGTFNPVNARLIVSPMAQMRPKLVMPSIEAPTSVRSLSRLPENSPRPPFSQTVNSPKRPLPTDDDEPGRPYKMARGESPLKGAAGRRLDQQRRHGGAAISGPQPTPIPRDITFILGLIPGAEMFQGTRYRTDGFLRLLQNVHVPTFGEYRAQAQSRDQGPRQLQNHNRQASAEYAQYGQFNRNSPAPTGRPISPYGRPVMPTAAAATYRNSPLRPGSSGSYDPVVYPPPPLPTGYTPGPVDNGKGWPPATGPYGQQQPSTAPAYPPGQQQYQPRYY